MIKSIYLLSPYDEYIFFSCTNCIMRLIKRHKLSYQKIFFSGSKLTFIMFPLIKQVAMHWTEIFNVIKVNVAFYQRKHSHLNFYP